MSSKWVVDSAPSWLARGAAVMVAFCAAISAPLSAASAGMAKPATVAQASPEARLLEIYRLLRAHESSEALSKAESLARDVPNFQLAQLVYRDLLLTRRGKLAAPNVPPPELSAYAATQWAQLRQEATRHLAALTERSPSNALPRQFIDIPASTRHAIAVDATRSRLYLFENGPHGMKLVDDKYVSLGRLGVDKLEEGDQRTPLGVYFIISRLDAKQLKEFYDPGALTLNDPNEYNRRRENRQRYLAARRATGKLCAHAGGHRNSPRQVPSNQLERERSAARALKQWRVPRSRGNMSKLMGFHSPQFSTGEMDLSQWATVLDKESKAARGRASEVKGKSRSCRSCHGATPATYWS